MTRALSRKPLPRFTASQKLDNAAARILVAAARSIGKAIARREALDAEGRADETLVVLLGQEHRMVATHVHDMKFIDGLIAAGGRPAVALENRHSRLSEAFRASNDNLTTAQQEAQLALMDHDGALSLVADSAGGKVYDGHQTYAAFNRFLRARRVTARFTDATIYTGQVLLGSDPMVAAVHNAEMKTPPPEEIAAYSPAGVRIRNAITAQLAHGLVQQFPKAARPRYLVVPYGFTHVAGYTPDELAGEHSLAARFKGLGYPVLAGHVRQRDITQADIPEGHGLSRRERMTIYGLPSVRAFYDPDSPGPIPGHPASMVTPLAEVTYLNGLLRRCGLGSIAMTLKQQEIARGEDCAEMHRAFIRARSAALRVPSA